MCLKNRNLAASQIGTNLLAGNRITPVVLYIAVFLVVLSLTYVFFAAKQHRNAPPPAAPLHQNQ